MRGSRLLATMFSLLLVVSLLAGCGGGGKPAGGAASDGQPGAGPGASGGAAAPAKRGELRIAMQYDHGALDPQVLTSVTDKQTASNLFEGLVRYKLGTVEVEPALATEWKPSEDGKIWEFTLRKGVKFHKGFGEMKAGDVTFSLKRLLDPALKSPNAALLKELKSADVVDDYRVRVELKNADPAFLDKLANSFTAIVSEQAVKQKGDKFAHDPVGTGRYQFDHWTPQQETVLTAFDEYWGGKPGLAKVVYVPIPDPTTMYNAFEAGDVDLIQVTDPDKLKKYKQNANMAVDETPGLITRFFGMNRKHPPFDNKQVRLAVIHAINKPHIIDYVFGGISTPARSILAPGVQHVELNVKQYEYNPQLSKQLLAEAGFPNGFKTTFYVPNVDRFTNPATVIKDNLKAVGIDVDIQVMETQAFLAKLKLPEGMPMFMLSRGQDATPDRVLYTWHHSKDIPANNWANISIPEVDRWLDEATRTVDENKRKELFSNVQKRVVEEAYYFYLDHENHVYAMHGRVKGFKGDPQRSIRLDNVTVQG